MLLVYETTIFCVLPNSSEYKKMGEGQCQGSLFHKSLARAWRNPLPYKLSDSVCTRPFILLCLCGTSCPLLRTIHFFCLTNPSPDCISYHVLQTNTKMFPRKSRSILSVYKHITNCVSSGIINAGHAVSGCEWWLNYLAVSILYH